MSIPLALPHCGIALRNSEGYPDPTVYRALKNLQRAEYGYRPLAYICSPYSGDVAANVELARDLCALAVTRRRIPLAPHLLFPQFMDDTDPDTRELAMFFNRILMTKCEELWVYTGRVTSGMRLEIDWAHHLELPIRYIDADFEEVSL